ncbi:MAG: SHOCT-like domain-containing protein, partial [Roseiflexus sp.]
MPVQQVSVGETPRIRFGRCTGSLRIEPGETGIVEVWTEADEGVVLERDDQGVVVQGMITGDCRLRTPPITTVSGEGVNESVFVVGIASFSLDSAGDDVRIEEIGGTVILGRIKGDLLVNRAAALNIGDVEGSAQITAVEGALAAHRVEGDLSISDVGSVEVQYVEGDLRLSGVRGNALFERIGGDAVIERIERLHVTDTINGDVRVNRSGVLVLNDVAGDVGIDDVQSLTVGAISGMLHADSVAEVVRFRDLDGDLRLRRSEHAAVEGGSVGGDVRIEQARMVMLGSVGDNADMRAISGDVSIGSVGSDATCIDIGGVLNAGGIGGDLTLRNVSSATHIGNIGGDLMLAMHFAPDSAMKLNIGGNAQVELLPNASLTLRATVGGMVRGPGVAAGSGMFSIVYGEGAALLELIVGSDLLLRGLAPRRVSSMSDGSPQPADAGQPPDNDIGRWAERFAEEMGCWGEQFGRDMSRWAEEFSREMGGRSDEWARRSQRKAERLRQRIERDMRKAAERARERARREGRPREVHVRINDREWRFDEERLERMKREAAAAAQAGIIGAIEAVERALESLGIPRSRPPHPPHPPGPPHPSQPP